MNAKQKSIATIANAELGIASLSSVGHDDSDFVEVSKTAIEIALDSAYEAGRRSATAKPQADRVFATIVSKNVGAAGRAPIVRPFFDDETGSGWAVPREYESRALRMVGQRVEIEIRSREDQFAYPVGWSS